MAVLTASQLQDLLTTTLPQLNKAKWTDISLPLQEYVAMPRLMKKGKVTFDGGDSIEFNLKVRNTGNAANVGLFNTVATNIDDTMIVGSVPWKHSNTSYTFDLREKAMNGGVSQVQDLIKTRRLSSQNDMTLLQEDNFWTAPTGSSDLSWMGVPYWIVKAVPSVDANGEFCGGNPTGFSDGAANVSSTTYTSWRNWSANYTNVTKEDLIRKIRRAAYKTNFKLPNATPELRDGDEFMFATNYDVQATMEEVLEAQNDNLGDSLDPKTGKVIFKNVKVTTVPYLDDDTSDPFYGINFGTFKPFFLKGHYFVDTGPEMPDAQPMVRKMYVDVTGNYICYDRRRNFVIYKA